jgi:hypothetical protein
VAGSDSETVQNAAKSAAELHQSAQSFENATEPITSKIMGLIMKVLSIFSW